MLQSNTKGNVRAVCNHNVYMYMLGCCILDFFIAILVTMAACCNLCYITAGK